MAVATVSYSFTVTSDSSEAVELIDEAESPCCCPKGPWRAILTTEDFSPIDISVLERADKNEDGIICYNGRRGIRFMDNIGRQR